jgi:hypothetical protein
MVKRAYKWTWTARIERETLTALQDLARELGYVVDVVGGHYGDASPAGMLDALAAAYRADSGAVIDAMREIGVINTPDAPPPSSPTIVKGALVHDINHASFYINDLR